MVTAPSSFLTFPAVSLPEELTDWAESHKATITRLTAAVCQKPGLNEHSLWELIAAEFSPEWELARRRLLRAEAQVKDAMRPENRPLGLIGKALHSDEINHITRLHNIALTGFTVINEDLRADAPLAELLAALRAHQQTLQQSTGVTQGLMKMTAEFDAAVSGMPAETPETPAAHAAFGKAARLHLRRNRTPAQGSLAAQFVNLLFGGKPAETTTAPPTVMKRYAAKQQRRKPDQTA